MSTSNPQVVIGTTANANQIQTHANDAAFVSAKGSAAAAGDVYTNTTDGMIHWYDGVDAAWQTAVSITEAQTLTNKTLTNPTVTTGTFSTPLINGIRRAYVLKNSSTVTSYIVAVTDYCVDSITDTAAQTFTLPTAVGYSGLEFEFIYSGTGYANALTIDGNLTETVGGSATTTLNRPGERLRVRSDGTNFIIVDRHIPGTSTSVTLTHGFTGGSNAITCYMQAIGDCAEFIGDITFTGVFTGGTATLTLPSGFVFDTAKIAGTVSAGVTPKLGVAEYLDVGTNNYVGGVYYNSTTQVLLLAENDDSGSGAAYNTSLNAVTTTAPFTWANADRLWFRFKAPIVGWKG